MLLANPLIKCEEVYNDTPEQPSQYETEDESQYDAELWESGVEREYESIEDANEYDDEDSIGNNSDDKKDDTDNTDDETELDEDAWEDSDDEDADIEDYNFNDGTPPVENNFLDYTVAQTDFREELVKEVKCFNPPFQAICIAIIHLLENNGLLPMSIKEVAEECNISIKDAEKAVQFIQDNLEPPGIAARDKYEYLLLQLKRQGKDTPIYKKLLTEYHEYDDPDLIAREFNISTKELKIMMDELRNLKLPFDLSPRRGVTEFIDPIVEIISDDNGQFQVHLADEKYIFKLPNRDKFKARQYKKLNKYNKNANKISKEIKKEITKEMKDYDDANALLQAWKQANETSLQMAQIIADVQRDFLTYGIPRLKPYTQKEAAVRINVDEGTVSRIVNPKKISNAEEIYRIGIRTPQGVFPLQDLFQKGFTSKDGKQYVRDYVKAVLKRLINEEDKAKPCSDEELRNLINEELNLNTDLSRETVTKYREELKIGNSRERKNR